MATMAVLPTQAEGPSGLPAPLAGRSFGEGPHSRDKDCIWGSLCVEKGEVGWVEQTGSSPQGATTLQAGWRQRMQEDVRRPAPPARLDRHS